MQGRACLYLSCTCGSKSDSAVASVVQVKILDPSLLRDAQKKYVVDDKLGLTWDQIDGTLLQFETDTRPSAVCFAVHAKRAVIEAQEHGWITKVSISCRHRRMQASASTSAASPKMCTADCVRCYIQGEVKVPWPARFSDAKIMQQFLADSAVASPASSGGTSPPGNSSCERSGLGATSV